MFSDAAVYVYPFLICWNINLVFVNILEEKRISMRRKKAATQSYYFAWALLFSVIDIFRMAFICPSIVMWAVYCRITVAPL